mmetsp:Transcript_28155/g.90254  ORF Transcript_28155/g.90254 Transcript_28155/m.90254 type:complete len:532 (+) Transcript_28155:22-1617(+)
MAHFCCYVKTQGAGCRGLDASMRSIHRYDLRVGRAQCARLAEQAVEAALLLELDKSDLALRVARVEPAHAAASDEDMRQRRDAVPLQQLGAHVGRHAAEQEPLGPELHLLVLAAGAVEECHRLGGEGRQAICVYHHRRRGNLRIQLRRRRRAVALAAERPRLPLGLPAEEGREQAHPGRSDAERCACELAGREGAQLGVDCRGEGAGRAKASRRRRGDVANEAHLAVRVDLVEGDAGWAGLPVDHHLPREADRSLSLRHALRHELDAGDVEGLHKGAHRALADERLSVVEVLVLDIVREEPQTLRRRRAARVRFLPQVPHDAARRRRRGGREGGRWLGWLVHVCSRRLEQRLGRLARLDDRLAALADVPQEARRVELCKERAAQADRAGPAIRLAVVDEAARGAPVRDTVEHEACAGRVLCRYQRPNGGRAAHGAARRHVVPLHVRGAGRGDGVGVDDAFERRTEQRLARGGRRGAERHGRSTRCRRRRLWRLARTLRMTSRRRQAVGRLVAAATAPLSLAPGAAVGDHLA